MRDGRLLLVHLSDIHFRYLPGGDLDADLRNEMELDAEHLTDELGAAYGVLVTGDVGFAGQAQEYDTATKWLSMFCGRVRCPAERVWVIPGNHDVDRAAARGSVVLRDAQERIRRAGPDRIDDVLREYVNDQYAGPLLLEPLASFNHFAAQFGCATVHSRLYWEDDLPLGRVFTLRVRGVNSALVSNERDDNATNKLVVGALQATVKREPGVAYLTLCHHPPDWLADYEAVEEQFNSRVHVQLFGHKHRQRTQSVGELPHRSLRVFAGAVHPSRREPGWEPRYNMLALSVGGGEADPYLTVEVWPRVWNAESTSFVPDHDREGRPFRSYRLPLVPARSVPPAPSRAAGVRTSEAPVPAPTTAEPEEADMGPQRRLMYRFFSLAFHKRVAVAVKLDLLRDEDEGIEDNRLFERVLQRAQENGRLADLWEAVEAQHGTRESTTNPFK